MDILAGRLTRAMRADMADNEARLVSLAGERFSQSAIEEVGTYDIDNLRARAEAAEAEVTRLRAALELADADLWGANLWGANLRGANLRGANLTDAIMPAGYA